MRAKEFLLEYSRQKTVQMMGPQIVNAFMTGGDKRTYELHSDTYKDQNGNPNTDKILNDVLTNLENSDPTPNKIYTPWIAREYAKGNIKRIEDAIVWLPTYLARYDKAKRRQDFRQDAKDIMRLNFTQFFNIISNYEPPPEPIKDRGQAKQVFKDENVRVIVPEDQQAACYYGQGTTWCTAATQSSNYYERYARQGKLYILLPTKPRYDGEKYQLHFATGQFMDETDEPIDIADLLTVRFPELLPFFKEHEPEINNLVVFADDKLLETIGNKIQELALDHISELFSDWEVNDDSFREWQWEEAERMGIIDPETMDEDEIWDIINNNDKLNDYSDYNPEARYSYKLLQNSINLSAREIKAFAERMANQDDGNGEAITISGMDSLYSFAVHDYFGMDSGRRSRGNDDFGLSEWIYKHISVGTDGTVKYHQ
jgi:hypothetical protein